MDNGLQLSLDESMVDPPKSNSASDESRSDWPPVAETTKTLDANNRVSVTGLLRKQKMKEKQYANKIEYESLRAAGWKSLSEVSAEYGISRNTLSGRALGAIPKIGKVIMSTGPHIYHVLMINPEDVPRLTTHHVPRTKCPRKACKKSLAAFIESKKCFTYGPKRLSNRWMSLDLVSSRTKLTRDEIYRKFVRDETSYVYGEDLVVNYGESGKYTVYIHDTMYRHIRRYAINRGRIVDDELQSLESSKRFRLNEHGELILA